MTRIAALLLAACTAAFAPAAVAQPLPGGSLDPLSIPKYVTPLVIPPVMKNDGVPLAPRPRARPWSASIAALCLPLSSAALTLPMLRPSSLA